MRRGQLREEFIIDCLACLSGSSRNVEMDLGLQLSGL